MEDSLPSTVDLTGESVSLVILNTISLDFGRPKSKEIVFKITNETDSPVKSTVDGKESSIDPRYTITYEQCRPPEVRIQLPTETTTLHPGNGGHYIIRKDESGKFTVGA